MNARRRRYAAIGAVFGLSIMAFADAPATRRVELTYATVVEPLPADAKAVDLWLPVAQNTDGQVVTSVTVKYPDGGATGTEPKYGNKIWHKRFEAPFDGALHDGKLGAEIVFVIERTEISVKEAKTLAKTPKGGAAMAAYLGENALIPTTSDAVNTIARDLKLADLPPIAAARKTYDWMIDTFKYDFAAPGAGIGDARWACDAKTGDCSDYSSTFIAVMRNQGVPADHEFGFPIRTKAESGRILFYHCWPRFYAEGVGWIPLDISEADKHPELREYNFGSQSANLFKFTHGRDIVLEPPQAGPPLNKFIYPYAEIDGAPMEKVPYTVSYH